MSPRCGGLGFRVLCKPARIPFMASGPCFRTRSRTLAVALVGNTFLSCTQWVRAKLNDPGVTNWVHVAGRHRCCNGSDIVRRIRRRAQADAEAPIRLPLSRCPLRLCDLLAR